MSTGASSSRLGALLAFAGRNGALLLFVGVLTGLVLPALADAARPLLGLAVFVFTLGAFLKVDAAAFRLEIERGWATAALLLWTTFGVPVVTLAVVWWADPPADIGQGLLLCMLAPPVGSAAAIAAMLELSAPLALLATVAATILCPVTVPPMASWMLDTELVIDAWGIAVRLLAIVGSACTVATGLRRFANGFVRQNPHAMTGIAVLGLILVAIGAMRGMQAHFLASPGQVAIDLAIAFLANAGFQALGTLLFARAGRVRALTVGLVSGNRNVTLIWAASGASLADRPLVELFLAMSVFPIFMLPLMERRLLTRFTRRSRPQQASTSPWDAEDEVVADAR